jgi:hypothetical protein
MKFQGLVPVMGRIEAKRGAAKVAEEFAEQ